ncbi:diguanylate cyclase [Conexibacter stalactiti]|uniref:Diguanylate cyclase n=1 Tax=Conexibacter stalactiti TaxID=1940611 RepID=A0ABU4HR27_9ACTN|nr:diguanylate cyclase [Conexibacter stalactiti]MDW5595756.1 diguanylate cyclase [Conexibacter stalactiti]MEC5036398.1 diguanylate cyclase [Conexibacter stalactiti]
MTDHPVIAVAVRHPGLPAHALHRVLLAATVAGLAALVAHALLPDDGEVAHILFDHALYLSLELAGVLACVARAVLVAQRRVAWGLIAAAAGCWLAGDVVWTFNEQAPHYPDVADVFYLAWYPLAAAGIVVLLTGRRDGEAARLWLDGLIGGLALAALATAVLWDELVSANGAEATKTAVELAYPIGDIALVGLVLTAFATQGWRPSRGWLLLGAGAVTVSIADTAYLVAVATGGYREGSLISVLWPAALLCCGWAAWQSWPRPDPQLMLRRELFLFPACFALVALGITFYGQLREIPLAASLLALAAMVVAVGRASANYRVHMRLLALSQQEARTDGLTGLANRRALIDDLVAALADGAASSPRTLAFFDLDGFKRYNDGFGHVAGDMLLRRLAVALRGAVGAQGTAYRLGGDEFCALLDGTHAPDGPLLRRCRDALSEHGEGFEVTTSFGVALLPSEAGDAERALGVADERMYAQKDGRRPASRRQTADVLMAVLREREPELRDHSDGVTELSLAVARRLGLAGERLDEVARAAELHDIGKIAVPEVVLHKPGPLDDDEWRLMRQHTVIGDRILSASPAMRQVALLVRASHERWDGGGYPDGLAGEAIPLGARIVAVCDAYSAMTSERPYQVPLAHEAAVAELRRCAGAQFDPRVVDAFCAVTFCAVAGPCPAAGTVRAAGSRHAA